MDVKQQTAAAAVCRLCHPDCAACIVRQEEYDDDALVFCDRCQQTLVGLLDDVTAHHCECIGSD